MEQKNSKIFNKTIMQAVSAFCDANNIEDKDEFIYLCFKQGFDIKKFGLLGETLNDGEKHLKNEGDSGKMGGIREKWVENEVIREKRVEIPVEIIKEVEKIVEVIKEVPVDRIVEKEIVREVPIEKVVIQEVIKEIPVDRVIEKEIYITDNTQVSELLNKIEELEQEKQKFSTKVTELETKVQEFSTKMVEMENIFQNKMSKKDEELDELRRNLDKLPTEIEKIVEVEKIIEVDNSSDKLKMMSTTLQNLRNELSLKNGRINDLEKINQELQKTANLQSAIYMKGSNLNSKI